MMFRIDAPMAVPGRFVALGFKWRPALLAAFLS
jgi:hypothetical protein